MYGTPATHRGTLNVGTGGYEQHTGSTQINGGRLGKFDRLRDVALPGGRSWYAAHNARDVTPGAR